MIGRSDGQRETVPLGVAHVAEVVDVRALAVDELAELAMAHEVEREHLDIAVAAVLELHAVAARALGRLDARPALLQRHRRRHFDGDVLAVLHRVERDRRVQLPGRRDVDEIEVAVAHRLPRLRLVGTRALLAVVDEVAAGRRAAVLLHDLLHPVDARLVEVAERRDLHAGNRREAVHRAGAAHPEAHHADAHLLDRRHRERRHRARSADPGGGRDAARQRGGRPHPHRSLEKITTARFHVVHVRLIPFPSCVPTPPGTGWR